MMAKTLTITVKRLQKVGILMTSDLNSLKALTNFKRFFILCKAIKPLRHVITLYERK